MTAAPCRQGENAVSGQSPPVTNPAGLGIIWTVRAGVFLVSAVLVMAALVPSAYAGTRADYKLMFTTPVPGTSTV